MVSWPDKRRSQKLIFFANDRVNDLGQGRTGGQCCWVAIVGTLKTHTHTYRQRYLQCASKSNKNNTETTRGETRNVCTVGVNKVRNVFGENNNAKEFTYNNNNKYCINTCRTYKKKIYNKIINKMSNNNVICQAKRSVLSFIILKSG